MENKELRFAKEKLRIFWCGVFVPLRGWYNLERIFRDENVFSPPYGEAGAQRLRGFAGIS